MRGFHIPIWRKMTAKIKKVKMPDLSLQVKIMLYIAALACAVLSIVSITCGGIFPPAAEYAVYTAAGVTLFLSCFYLAGDLDLLKQKIMELARSNTLTARLTDDIEYRSVLFAVCGVCMNIVFALFNGIAGWMSRSAWFGTLSAYYLILGMMRAYWIFHNQDKVRNRENQRSSRAPERNIWRCYGVLFLFLAVVLCGAVILLVNLEGGKTYPGWTIYAAAGYSFTKIILAAVHVIRARKKKEQFSIHFNLRLNNFRFSGRGAPPGSSRKELREKKGWVTTKVNDRWKDFCSEECRNRYIRNQTI